MKHYSAKICLLGDFAVGKTSLIRRYVYNLFDDMYMSTIGVKVSRRTLMLTNGRQTSEIALMLWDIASSENFALVRSSYLRGSVGAVLVCDLTRPETMSTIYRYAEDVYAVNRKAHLVIAANKCDVPFSDAAINQVSTIAASLGVMYFSTSARDGTAVDPMFAYLAQQIFTQ